MTPLLQAIGIFLPRRLDPMSLEVAQGELVALIGPNGSGKTSLLHALAGVGRPSGRVLVAGAEPMRLPQAQRAKLLSYLPAGRDLHWPLAARDVVALSGASEEQIERVMAQFQLAALAERRMDRLSTGERSRVLIARAFAVQPRLLLLDEPMANLDPLWQLRLADLLRSELRQGDRAAIIAMHDLDAAAACADRLIVMEGGRVAASGEPAALMGGPAIPEIFGIERSGDRWRPVSSPEDPRSSP